MLLKMHESKFQTKISEKNIFPCFVAFLGAHFGPGVNPTKLFFFVKQRFFPFSATKLGHFKAKTIFSYSANTQA